MLRAAPVLGNVASGTYSPTLEHGIATAYLPIELTEEGTELEIRIRKKVAPARVKKVPFVGNTSLKD